MQLNCNCCFADDPARLSVGADGERSRQRQRSATDAAYPFRVHIGPSIRFHRTAAFAATPQPLLRRPTFSVFPEKVGKKRRWMRIGLYRSATEVPRRRTLRPAHENLSAKLDYSAACVETMLPSMIVATQEAGKTRCHGNNWTSTYAPMVHNSCILLQMFVGAEYSGNEEKRNYCSLPASACSTLVGTESYQYGCNLAPEQGAEKNLRVSAINRSPAPLFAHFFWQGRKEWARGATVAVLLQKRQSGANRNESRPLRGSGREFTLMQAP